MSASSIAAVLAGAVVIAVFVIVLYQTSPRNLAGDRKWGQQIAEALPRGPRTQAQAAAQAALIDDDPSTDDDT